MFALRQRILGPATTSVAKRSFRSDLVQHQHHASCVSLLATDTLPQNTTAATRRNISTTTFNHNHFVAEESSLLGLFTAAAAAASNNNANKNGILTAATTTAASLSSPAPSIVARMAVAMVSNWFMSVQSAWNNDGLFLISTLKRRRKMMNKHKLRKRRKKNRMKNKK
jgi:hypothetical protein